MSKISVAHGQQGEHHMCIILVNNAILPQTDVSYLVFRIAFCETLERITLARHFPSSPQDGFGFLIEVPFLSNVSPAVQLDLLAATWERHNSDHPVEATLLDESVIYAACERAAWCLENESPAIIKRYLQGGPQIIDWSRLEEWADMFRKLHLGVSADADFLLISQFEDMPPVVAAEIKEEWSVAPSLIEPLFEALGEWHPSPEMRNRLSGLLTKREIDLVSDQFRFPVVAE